MQNLLRLDYEKILLLASAIFRGDYRLTVGERVLSIYDWGLEINPGSTLDVNRLVIDTSMRGSGIMSKALLDCFQWIKNNSIHSNLVAFCAEKLVPLYTKIGAQLIISEINSPTILDKKYSLMALSLGKNDE